MLWLKVASCFQFVSVHTWRYSSVMVRIGNRDDDLRKVYWRF